MGNSKLVTSLLNVQRKSDPWEYFSLRDCLTDAQIFEIFHAQIDRESILHDGTRSGYKEGVEKQNDNLREYVTKENQHLYPALVEFIEELRTERVRSLIAEMVGNENNFEGSYVRLEILHDTQGFYLKPHCDIPEKLISSLIYLNRTDEDLSLGTDLYDTDLNLQYTVPFEHNTGYIFHGEHKWHGMEEGKLIKVERRGIQLNYVTFPTDWKV